MARFRKILATGFRLIPAYNSFLYYVCRRYVDRYEGSNDSNIGVNGEAQLVQERAKHWKIVFDVGANVGEWTDLVLKANPEAVIHCFEPSVATFRRLQANNYPSTVYLNNVGLGDEPATRSLYIFSEAAGINSLYPRAGLELALKIDAAQTTETVTITTLDAYCREHGISHIDFLKVDVEGHELAVLRGAKEMLSKRQIAAIQFECALSFIDARVLLKDFFDLLQPLGYSFYKIFPDHIKKHVLYDQLLENYKYQNWLVVADG